MCTPHYSAWSGRGSSLRGWGSPGRNAGSLTEALSFCWWYGPYDVAASESIGMYMDDTLAADAKWVSNTYLASFQAEDLKTIIYAAADNALANDVALTPFSSDTDADCTTDTNGYFHVSEDITVKEMYAEVADGVSALNFFNAQLWIDGVHDTSCACQLSTSAPFSCSDTFCGTNVDEGSSICILFEEQGTPATPTALNFALEVEKRL